MERQIFFHDTDSGGIVYYANYLKYMEEARTEFLKKRGLSVSTFQQRGLMYVVRKCSLTYRSPARYGETITCDAKIKKITAAQLIFAQNVYNKQTSQLLVEAEITLACLTDDLRPVQIPEDLKTKLL